MKPWLSMMPVEGEINAATQASSGSSARAALPPMGSRSVTPFLAAVSLMAASLGSWLSCVATSSLPQRACDTLFSAQKAIEQLLAAHAQRRAQAAGRIVDAGVDHLAVAGGSLRADQLVLLQHHHLVAGHGQRPGDGQPDRAGADDDGFDVGGHGVLPCACAARRRSATCGE